MPIEELDYYELSDRVENPEDLQINNKTEEKVIIGGVFQDVSLKGCDEKMEDEGRLQIEYAKLRRMEFYKKGKKYTIERQAELISKEWNSFTDEQKINMQKFLDKQLKKKHIKDGYRGKKFQAMKERFKGKHAIDFEDLADKKLVEEIDERNAPDLQAVLKTAPNPAHYMSTVAEIVAQVDQRAKKKKDTKVVKQGKILDSAEKIKQGLQMNQQYKIKYRFDQFHDLNPNFHLRLDGYVYFAQKTRQKMKEGNPNITTGQILAEIHRKWQHELSTEEKQELDNKSEFIMD